MSRALIYKELIMEIRSLNTQGQRQALYRTAGPISKLEDNSLRTGRQDRTVWQMRELGSTAWQEAVVPGTVYTDLLRNGKMEDPFWKDNEDKICALMEKDYEYRCRFTLLPGMLKNHRVVLHFDGLDTLADIYVNQTYAGKAYNMHRIWEFDVKDLLQEGENELQVIFHSPLKYIAEAYKKYGNIGNDDTYEGFMHLRKAHYMFGWDWGPRLPDAGIWKDVFLEGVETGRLESVYVTQEYETHKVTLHISAKIARAGKEKDSAKDAEVLSYRVTVTDPKGNVRTAENSPESLVIPQPLLWWPNGYGEQNLYGICVQLMKGGREIDRWEKRIGLRTMTMHREKDAYGESFAHEVNGVQIFAMGADYIPEDNIFSRITGERTRNLLEQCRAANFNCIRVWGGGFYPHDDFYDICDELGLVVWQDLMFACAVYELTEEFDKNIRAEIRDNVRRLRHHASLGLWCGNNEMEMFVDEGQWVNTPKQKADYIKMYEYIICLLYTSDAADEL